METRTASDCAARTIKPMWRREWEPGMIAIQYLGSERVIELGLAELRGASLAQQDFLRADLSGRDLAGAVFRDCELRAACLDWASLEGARFDHARLMSATFRHAHMRGVSLRHASLRRSDLSGACLIGADLTGASLRQAHLDGANLCGATCLWIDDEGLSVEGALYDGATQLPPAFRPSARGMIRRLTASRA